MIDEFFSASIDPHAPTIDLHDAPSVRDAEALFETELMRLSRDAQYVRVIHGIGSGVLRDHMIDVFARHPMVRDARTEDHGGSTIILL